ncbi:hypothetical protein [Salinarchaeum laminariae]|uniref:hypothetical protein n=1 Tax=Salinarchaeum laminariae TaxID=869888 RepID=UPI0020BDD7BD|nr:hypothetical protein [Salinarchaeum laminariae]
MTIIQAIPPRDVRTAFTQAAKRNEPFEEREGYDNDANRWGVDPEDRNFTGVMGEMALAVYADLQIDSTIYDVGDGGIDFRVAYQGEERTIDVKTRTKDPFALWVKEGSLRADWYVLGHLRSPPDSDQLEGWSVELIGRASKEELLDAEMSKSDYGHQNHSILRKDLHPIPEPDDLVMAE